jgi:hypothetical protein
MNEKELKIANRYLNESDEDVVDTEEIVEAEFEDEEEEGSEPVNGGGIIKVFYSDLDLKKRNEVLEALDKRNEFVDVFRDDVIKKKIEKEFDSKPLFTLTGDEIANRMNFDF